MLLQLDWQAPNSSKHEKFYRLIGRMQMQPLEYLIESLMREIGTDTAFQVVYEAVNTDIESPQATLLSAALHAVTERRKQQELHRAWLEEEMKRPWTL